MSANVSHRKKIAKTLARQTGIPYTRALALVDRAAAARLLPQPYTAANAARAVAMLTDPDLATRLLTGSVTDPLAAALVPLGMTRADHLATVRAALGRPQGLVLVVGPAGSGKSTTVRALLGHLVDQGQRMASLDYSYDSPVAGVDSIPVANHSGPDAIRHTLRGDHDMVHVNEIRDGETFTVASEAVLHAGTSMLGTLHTGSASTTVHRLLQAVPDRPDLVAAVTCVIAQRLLPRMCPACRVPVTVADGDLGRTLAEPVTVYAATGCDACSGTGRAGRVGVFVVTDFGEAGGFGYDVPADAEFAFREETWVKTLAGEISVEEYRRRFPGAWYVRSEDGADYRVGRWSGGLWVPGSRADAERELALLGEPGASVVWRHDR